MCNESVIHSWHGEDEPVPIGPEWVDIFLEVECSECLQQPRGEHDKGCGRRVVVEDDCTRSGYMSRPLAEVITSYCETRCHSTHKISKQPLSVEFIVVEYMEDLMVQIPIHNRCGRLLGSGRSPDDEKREKK